MALNGCSLLMSCYGTLKWLYTTHIFKLRSMGGFMSVLAGLPGSSLLPMQLIFTLWFVMDMLLILEGKNDSRE